MIFIKESSHLLDLSPNLSHPFDGIVLQIALAKSSMAKASQMWQEAAEEEMSVTEAYMKRMTDSKRVSEFKKPRSLLHYV